MSQIAQQDHLVLEDEGRLSGLHQSTKDKLKHCVVEGTILDVVIKTIEAGNKKNVSKVVGYEFDTSTKASKVVFLNTSTGDLYTLNLEAL